jgi:hypothetical protein
MGWTIKESFDSLQVQEILLFSKYFTQTDPATNTKR